VVWLQVAKVANSEFCLPPPSSPQGGPSWAGSAPPGLDLLAPNTRASATTWLPCGKGGGSCSARSETASTHAVSRGSSPEPDRPAFPRSDRGVLKYTLTPALCGAEQAQHGPSTENDLLDHLVCAGEQRRWNGEAERLRSLEVDH
jgi:hypothetical protein